MFDYAVLKKQMQNYIDALHLQPGDRLPTEGQFCRNFNASHYQVRKVLSDLCAERGWVTIQGSGTYLPGGGERRLREKVIAVVFSYTRDIIMQLNEAHSIALENNFQLLLFGISHDTVEPEEECLNHLLTRRIHSLVIDPHPGNPHNFELLKRFEEDGTHVVLLNGSENYRANFPFYSFNYYRAGYMSLVHLMRQNQIRKAIHLRPWQSIAWQHSDFQRGIQEAATDFNFPVEELDARLLLDVHSLQWRWSPETFQLPCESECGYIVDNNPFEANYVQHALQSAQCQNTPIITVYHNRNYNTCTMLFFNVRERMNWIVNELIHNAGKMPRERLFNPSLLEPPENAEPYHIAWI